jgi:hypothetical protein
MFFGYGLLFTFVLILIVLDIFSKKKQILQFIILDFSFSYQKQNKLKIYTYIYILAAFTGAYSMILSPGFPSRAYFIIIVFSIISFYQILLQRNIILAKFNKIIKVILSILFIFIASNSLIYATRGVIGVYIRWHDRIEYIESEINSNNFDLEVPLIPSRNKFNALYELSDLKESRSEWPNTSIASYFGLNSISRNEMQHEELSLRKNIKKILFPVWLFGYPHMEKND